MVRYYGFYSNVCRGRRKKQNQAEWIPYILEPDGLSKEHRKNWARTSAQKLDYLYYPSIGFFRQNVND
jgi:hypothetical protein